MLALSLQNEGQASSMVEQGFWESVPEADPARAGPTSLGDIKGGGRDDTERPDTHSV